ncbi:MAG TPA: histidine triad nucleotide-binding protein [Gammaproteobacteria bacterium]|jgi:histidine triad (HIT) family protein|nr:histidine triad nucleotide-binding protein [Gammaproteobacteria bacterium]
MDCLFCKIAAGEMNADIVFQDDDVVAFRDINPQASTHILIVPRRHVPTINDLVDEDAPLMGRLSMVARDLAAKEGIAEDGYRVVMNCNEGAGQTVWHIHLHLIGGRPMGWPPG